MVDRPYKSSSLTKDEVSFGTYFDQLASEFGFEYEIWIRSRDFGRIVAAGVVKRHPIADVPPVAVTIYFKHGRVIPNPLDEAVVEQVRHHLTSGATEDLHIHCPTQA